MSQTPESQQLVHMPHKLLVAGIAASTLLMASCSESHLVGEKKVHEQTLDFEGDSSTVTLVGDIEQASEFMSSSLTEASEQQVDDIADPQLKAYAQKQLDFMRVDNINTYDSDEEQKEKIEQVDDPDLRALAQKKIDADRAVELSDAWLDISAAQASLSNIVDPDIKAMAQKLYDVTVAEHVGYLSTTDLLTAKTALDTIQDSGIKAWATEDLDFKLASTAMNGYMNEDDTQAALDAITNPEVKSAAQANYRNSIGYDASRELEAKMYDKPELEQDIYEITSELRATATEYASTLGSMQATNRKAFKVAVREMLAIRAAQVAVPGEYLQKEFNPTEIIAPRVHLSDNQKENIQYSDEYGDDETVTDVNFAELSVDENGVLKFLFPDGSELDTKTQEQLELQFNNLKPFITAAFNNGSLTRIRFAIADYDPYYDPSTREIVIQIPEADDSDVTMDQLASGLLHETVHALTSGKSSGETLTPEEFMRFSSVCDAAGKQARDQFEIMAYDMNEDFESLKKYLPKDQQPVVDVVADAVRDGTLEELVFKDTNYSESGGLPFDCEVPNLFGLFYDAGINMGIVVEFAEGYLDDKQVVDLYNEWDDTVRYLSLYSKINESNFAKTDSYIKPYLGHSEDNASELIASFVDSVIYYKTELATVVREMDSVSQVAIVELLRESVDMITTDNPELAGVMARIEAEFLELLYAQ